jgi:hypothetical protein
MPNALEGEDYYGKADKMEMTAQFVLWALVVANRGCSDPALLCRQSWDVAEVFQKERDLRVSKYKNANRQ